MDDDFEQAFAEELELVRDSEEYGARVKTPSRRTLVLASPFLPPGATRKRPLEDTPLPPLPSDIDPSSSSGFTDCLLTTPTRGSTQSNTTRSKLSLEAPSILNDHHNSLKDGGLTRPYSPPAAYTPPSSPSPPGSPASTHLVASQPSVKRRKLGDKDLIQSPQRPRNEVDVSTSQSAGVVTPLRVATSGLQTPRSAGKYRRILEVESRPLNAAHEDNGSSRNSSLMDRFEATYTDLTRTSPPTTGATVDTVAAVTTDEEQSSLDTLQNTATQPHEYSSGLEDSGHVMLYPPMGCPYVSVTAADGSRVYLKLKPAAKYEGRGRKQDSRRFPLRHSQLLTVPFDTLRKFVEEERRRKLIERSDLLLKSLTSAPDETANSSRLLFDSWPEGAEEEEEDGEGGGRQYGLWVDHYSPKHYTELLSDDGINRTLLSWLKLWDEVVFGRPLAPPPPPRGAGRGGGGGGAKQTAAAPTNKDGKKVGEKKFEKKFDFSDPDTFSGPNALDDAHRPKIKLALLCGAPGLGKTTLAHVIAKHAGYNVVEMNASDDRSEEVFKQRLESATEMQAVLTEHSRPNCLIIDEIDGAPTAAINVLIKTVVKKDLTTGGKKMKKHGPISLISRPIICICNDQYAPSLRQLRQHAMVLHFPSTVTSRLATRLQQVCRREGLRAAMSTLMALCEKSENDIRSCLNTLQFIHGKQQQQQQRSSGLQQPSCELTLAAVQSASVGQKDARRSFFSLWRDVFQLRSNKKHTLNKGPLRMNAEGAPLNPSSSASSLEAQQSSNAARFHSILSEASATGEYTKVSQGLFENYLNVKFKDPNLEAVSVAQDWLLFHDTLQTRMNHAQDYSFMPYLPFLSVAFHFLFASPSKPPLRYPHTDFEMFQRHQRSSHLLSSLLLEATPLVRTTVTARLLATDILAPLCEIISPSFRPVSTQLYTAQEKRQLADLVATMISYSLSYHQERAPDGQYTYSLDPSVDELCRYPGLPQKKQLSYSAKQLIAREIDVEKMRRAERKLTGKDSTEEGRENPSSKQHQQRTPPGQRGGGARKAVDVRGLVATSPQVKESAPKDFFGRAVSTPKRSKGVVGRRGHMGGVASTTHPLWFKFNEGYSNAVRRPVRVQDLL